jgi:hypothetical protein
MDGASFYFIPLPWFIDLGSRLMGINVYGVEGFYIPYFYYSDECEFLTTAIMLITDKFLFHYWEKSGVG